jgi:dTDP-4-dehydrorhamnose reductase
MILLLGATSYIGQAFARALRRRKDTFVPLAKNAFDYTRFEFLFDYVRKLRPELVINAEETIAKNDANVGELERLEMLQSNVVLPQTVSRVCTAVGIPCGHVSSGSIYTGAKVVDETGCRIEEDLSRPAVKELFTAHPERFRGFSETDEPNFSFEAAPCTFYSGTKALAEASLKSYSQMFVWRFITPFNEEDEPRNLLTQLRDLPRFRDTVCSLSHLGDCVSACLELWDCRVPYGTYNVVNPGAIRTQEVAQMLQKSLKPTRGLELLLYDDASCGHDEKEVRSDCILDASKILAAGVKMRNVREALQRSLLNWVSQSASSVVTSI